MACTELDRPGPASPLLSFPQTSSFVPRLVSLMMSLSRSGRELNPTISLSFAGAILAL
jgi:hypothetical protein